MVDYCSWLRYHEILDRIDQKDPIKEKNSNIDNNRKIAMFAVNFLFHATRQLIYMYCQGEDIGSCYKREIQ